MKKGGILNLLNKVKALNVDKISQKAIQDTAPDIKRLNQEQLFDGLLNDGTEITNVYNDSPFYSEAYAEYKGKSYPIDLHDKGDFYREIKIEVTLKKVLVTNADVKAPKLEKMYTKKILGIGTVYKKEYIAEDLKPALMREFKTQTGLK